MEDMLYVYNDDMIIHNSNRCNIHTISSIVIDDNIVVCLVLDTPTLKCKLQPIYADD